MTPYDPSNWFWIVGGDASKAWSSAAAAYVTTYPADRVTYIDTENNLRDVLWNAYPNGWPVPKTVATWQARAALALAGKITAANAAVAGCGDVAIQNAWEYATTFDRTSASVNSIGAAIGMSPADIDALFIAASALKV